MTSPTLQSSSPTDNSTFVATNTDVILSFSENVVVNSGNIIIYDYFSDSVIETIDVTSDQVTGAGTSQITIDLNNNLDDSTSYYVFVDNTAFVDSTNNFYAGISNKNILNFTTADETVPTLLSTNPSNNTSGFNIN